MTTTIVLSIYGLFLIFGGLFGFKKGSKVSLIMGLCSGILIFFGLWLLTFSPHTAWIFLICLNLLLSLVFLIRVIKTRAFMPSGMLLLVSLGALIFCFKNLV